MKAVKTKRIGANRRKYLDEQRARKPRASMCVLRKTLKVAVVVLFATSAGFAAFNYGPEAYFKISEVVVSGRALPANVRITNCSRATEAKIKCGIDLLAKAEPAGFDRADVIKAAATIPEVEKITVKKTRDRLSREKTTLIKVVERKPVALVHVGEICLVDKKGVRFTANPGQFYDLPLLVIGRGPLYDTVDLDVFNRIKKASQGFGRAFFQDISQIDISDASVVGLVFRSGETEYAVNPQDIEKKLVHVKELRDRLLLEDGGPARIDMRYGSLAFTSAQ